MRYELYYWPGIQGRGEFVRLALEDAGAKIKNVKPSGGQKITAERLPKFLGYFEQVLERIGSRVLVGNAVSYVDLCSSK